MKRRFLSISVVVLLLLSASALFAQEQTSSIQGVVTDSSGAVLPGVTVEATNARGQRYTAQTDSSGHYRFPSITPGVYTVTATLSGLTPATSNNVEARLGVAPRVDLKLGLSAVSETISVTAEAPVVDVTSSATATSIRSETFEQLPKGRDFTSLVTMVAGANNESKGGGISIDGATALENRFVVDGVDTTDPLSGGTGKRVITDVVDEVQVKSAGYEAEFGGATGGVINVITKTGTNQFSGTVSGLFRDRSWEGEERPTLQATTGASPQAEQIRLPEDDITIFEPGATLGGPILRDRVWFFGAYHPTFNRVERTVTFANPGNFPAVQTFEQDETQNNIIANVSGNLGTKALFKVSANLTGSETDNPDLPGRNGRSGSDPSLYNGLTDVGENDAYSGYFDYIPTPMLYLSARGGQMKTHFHEEGISQEPFRFFRRGSNSGLPGVNPADVRSQGFTNIVTNSATIFDDFKRQNYALEASFFPTFAGTHSIKGGFQAETVSNDVLVGHQNINYSFHWNQGDRFFTTERGTHGAVGVYVIQTTGAVESQNQAIFLQDSWNTFNNRLTLNIGVRAESEKIPDYDGVGEEYAINFDYGDKIAPRFGFAFDVFGNARTKAFGSYGKFYDQTKLELARGSFGGEKWIWHGFRLNTGDWQNINCTGVSNDPSAPPPNCGPNLSYINSIDLRHPSTDAIDPDLEPMTSQEYSLGVQHELTSSMAVGVRYVHKELLRAIEDLGTLVVDPVTGALAESYTIGNPGFGLSAVGGGVIPGFPKAVRDYDGVELELTRRFQNRWGVHASYLWSRLYGNYSGLAASDEGQFGTGRTDPNVSRWGDNIYTLFDASGEGPSMGPLATDRPHQFKAQLTYQLPIGTTVGVNQYVASGTPVSTQMFVHGAEFFPYGRGDLGRTPTLYQTDLYLAHRFNFAGRYGFEVSANVLNLLDSDTETARYQLQDNLDVTIDDDLFFTRWDVNAHRPKLSNGQFNTDPLFGETSQYQARRQVRLGVRFIF